MSICHQISAAKHIWKACNKHAKYFTRLNAQTMVKFLLDPEYKIKPDGKIVKID
jgi:hypothetical protein